MGGQLNSASLAEVQARKTSNIIRLINDWEVQGGCLSEVGIDWSTYCPSATLPHGFIWKSKISALIKLIINMSKV
jgi:hypothetical protein